MAALSAPREAPRRFVECAYRRRRFVINITGEVPRAPPRGNVVMATVLATEVIGESLFII